MPIPPELEREIERFRKAYGPGWEKRLIALLQEEIRRKAKKKAAEFMRKVSGKTGLTEEEVFRRLEEDKRKGPS